MKITKYALHHRKTGTPMTRKTFLVGGAVRDKLLDRPVKDRDWLVTGATAQDMLDDGFLRVGSDFPVFLHPETGEEHALARTERKTGLGHKAFEFDTSPHLTVEDDLSRRDLTINAMAMDDEGDLVDPFGGQADIANKVLRPVNESFMEDPLRVLRAFRFLARLGPDWTVVSTVHEMAFKMLQNGDFDNLSSERFVQELMKAMDEPHWNLFFNSTVLSVLAHRFGVRVSNTRRVLPANTVTERWFAFSAWNGSLQLLEAMGAPTKVQKVVVFSQSLRSFNEHGMVHDLLTHAERDMGNLTSFLDEMNKHRLNHKLHEVMSNLRFEQFNDAKLTPQHVRQLLTEARKQALWEFTSRNE